MSSQQIVNLYNTPTTLFHNWVNTIQIPIIKDQLKLLSHFSNDTRKESLNAPHVLFFFKTVLKQCMDQDYLDPPQNFSSQIKQTRSITGIIWAYISKLGTLMRPYSNLNLSQFMERVNQQILDTQLSELEILTLILRLCNFFMRFENPKTRFLTQLQRQYTFLLLKIDIRQNIPNQINESQSKMNDYKQLMLHYFDNVDEHFLPLFNMTLYLFQNQNSLDHAIKSRLIVYNQPLFSFHEMRKTQLKQILPLENIDPSSVLVTSRITQSDSIDSNEIRNTFGPQLLEFLPIGYSISALIGQGRFGKVYLLCQDGVYFKNCDLVIKIQTRNPKEYSDSAIFYNRMNREKEMQKKFSLVGLAPRVLLSTQYTYKHVDYFIILMDRVDGIVNTSLISFPRGQSYEDYCESIVNGIDHLIREMCKHNLIHADFKLDNVGYRIWSEDDKEDDKEYDKDYDPNEDDEQYDHRLQIQFVILDFGWASQGYGAMRCHPHLEFLKLLQWIIFTSPKYKNKGLANCILERIYSLYINSGLSPSPPPSLDYTEITDLYLRVFQEYVSQHYMRVSL